MRVGEDPRRVSIYLDAEGHGIEKEGDECKGGRERRIETENSISLPREPQARR